MNKISIIVPCFNEEEVLQIFYDKIKAEYSARHRTAENGKEEADGQQGTGSAR